MRFSVLKEPIVPVIYPNGRTDELGIRAVFEQAHELKDIRGATPMERYAMTRLLIAFAMDMLHLEDSTERQELLENGQFDMQLFDEYVEMCEADGATRFDLFDEQHPFLQARYDAKIDTEDKGVANLFQELPTGNNHMFFDHRYEDVHLVSAAEAFRAMCALYVFATAGAQGYPSSVNNTPPMYALILGNTLFESIVLNMLSKAECGNIPYGYGKVPWRSDCVITPKKVHEEVDMLEALTWQPRRITLKRDEDGFVRKIYLKQGKEFKGNSLWTDPHVPYRKKKDETHASIKPEAGRAIWRDAWSLTLDVHEEHGKQPTVIRLLRNVDIDEAWVRIRAMGLVTNNANLLEWMESELSLPACLLKQDDAAKLFRSDMDGIEQTYRELCQAVEKNMTKLASVQAGSVFLGLAHNALFGDLLADISSMDAEDMTSLMRMEHLQRYDEMLRDIIKKVIKEVVQCTGNSAREIQTQIDVEREIWARYAKYIKERRERYAE